MRTRAYTLNYYYKGVVSQAFDRESIVSQIVPDVYRLDFMCLMFTGSPDNDHDLNYHRTGFWRVAQPFKRKREFRTKQLVTDDTAFLQGQLVEVTFAPVWMDFGRTKSKPNSPLLSMDLYVSSVLSTSTSATQPEAVTAKPLGSTGRPLNMTLEPTTVQVPAPAPTTAQVPAPAPTIEQTFTSNTEYGDTRNIVAQQEHRKRKVTKKNRLANTAGCV